MKNSALLTDFIAAYPAQPATAYWRAIEIGAIVRYGLPSGFGLDLGCGDGKLTRIILSHVGSRTLVGVDLDPLEVEAARKLPFYERLHVASGEAIPEEDDTFDFVLSNSVLEHIPALAPTLAEVARLLKTGGLFLFTVPAPAFQENLRGPLMPGASRKAYIQSLDRRIAHFNYLDPEQWRDALSSWGLTMEACLGFVDALETQRWESLSRVTGGLFYSLFGESKRPIEIQRALGMRALQNEKKLPAPLAKALARAVSFGACVDKNADRWLDSRTASGLLIAGRKPS